jgi:glycosyltransferase involved in cell wall biosynthesis
VPGTEPVITSHVPPGRPARAVELGSRLPNAAVVAILVGLLALSALDRLGRIGTAGGAQFTVYQVGVALAFAYVVWSVAVRHEGLRRLVFAPWVALLLLGAAVTIPGAFAVRTAVAESLSMASAVGLACLAGWLCAAPGRIRPVLSGLLALCGVLAFLAVLEATGVHSVQSQEVLWGTLVRARVTMNDPNLLGGLLAAVAAAGVPLALSARGRLRPALLWAGIGVCAAGVFATGSRGALAGLVLGVVLAVVLTPGSRRAKLIAAALAGTGLLAGLAALGPAWITQRVIEAGSDPGVSNRMDLIVKGFRLFAMKPFGIGMGNWLTVFERTFGHVAVGTDESHMTLVTVLAEAGVPGFVGIVGAWVSAVAAALRTRGGVRSPEAVAAVAGAVVLIVQSATYSIETSKPLWFFIGLCAAAVVADRARRRQEDGFVPKVCILQYNSSRFLMRVDRAARALAGAGAEVVLIAIKDADTEAYEQRSCYVVKRVELVSRKWPRWTRPARWIEAVARTWAAALREHADAYDARDIYPLLVAWRAARVNDARFVYDSDELNLYRNWPWTSTLWWRVLAKAYEGFFVRRADSVITTDPGRVEALRELYGVEALLVRNVADVVDRVEADLAFRQLALKGRERLLLYTGNLVPNRGLEALVDAVGLLPECALAFVGAGHLAEPLRAMIRERGFEDRAEVYPPVQLDELMRRTAAADALVTPMVGACLSYVTGVLQKQYEAMMVGVPIVATDMGDMADLVRLERVGTLIADPADPASIADAVRRLFALGPEELAGMGARGRAAALDRYNWTLEKEILIEEYRRIGLLGPSGPAEGQEPL